MEAVFRTGRHRTRSCRFPINPLPGSKPEKHRIRHGFSSEIHCILRGSVQNPFLFRLISPEKKKNRSKDTATVFLLLKPDIFPSNPDGYGTVSMICNAGNRRNKSTVSGAGKSKHNSGTFQIFPVLSRRNQPETYPKIRKHLS